MIPADVLRRVPGCEDGQPPRVTQPLAGGRGCNQVWRVDTTRGRFVLRVRGAPVDRPGSLSRNELLAHRLAAGAGLAPALIDAAEDGRWLLMDYISADPWSAAWLQSPWGLDALGSRLRSLHGIEPPVGVSPVDPISVARGYVELAAAREGGLAREAESQFQTLAAEAGELAGLPGRVALNHGDLQAANLLGPLPLLVDWEYSQWADPTWDVACLLEYYPELRPRRDAVLEACGMDPARDGRILSLQQALFTRLNTLWSLAQPGAG